VRKKRHFKTILLVCLAVLICAGVFFVSMKFAKAPAGEQKTATATGTVAKITTGGNSVIISDGTIAGYQIPIMMYHHIRDYNDPTDQIGTNLSVAPAKFASQLDLIQQDGYQTITFNDILTKPLPKKPIILSFDDGYQNFYDNAWPELKKHNMTAVVYIIVNDNSGMYMTPTEIKELSASGVEVGSHTLSHPDLSKGTIDKAKAEIFDSKADLEKITGTKVVSFCYPSGKYNDAVIDAVKNAGYDFAVTTNGGIAKFSDPLTLNRHRMNSDTNISAYLSK